MRPRQALLWAVLAAASVTAQTPSVRVWAVSDGVRVNPVTGQIFEQRTDIHKDYPNEDFRSANSVWSEATKTISLRAARNEYVAFQVIVETPEGAQDVNVKFADLIGPNGVRIERKYLAIFKEWYVRVR